MFFVREAVLKADLGPIYRSYGSCSMPTCAACAGPAGSSGCSMRTSPCGVCGAGCVVEVPSEASNSAGAVHTLSGTVANDGTPTVQAVTVTATLWNSAGTVVGQPSGSLSSSSLAQGARASFSIPLTSAQLSETAAFEVAAGTAVGNVGDTLTSTEWENGGSLQTEPVATTFNSLTTPASIAGSLQTDTPPTGDEYVEVNLTVQNNGATTVDFDGMNELYIQDSAGNRYTPDLSTSVDAGNDLLGLSTLNAGQKVTGIAIFDVPTSATGLQLVWDSGTENQVFWNLGLQ